MARSLSNEQIATLHDATRQMLEVWTEALRAQAGAGFPKKVTALRNGMAVHGRYREPCPDRGAPVQRIVYADNETNYCARCQTDGKLLADRSLSRLLNKEWPRTIDELESLHGPPDRARSGPMRRSYRALAACRRTIRARRVLEQAVGPGH